MLLLMASLTMATAMAAPSPGAWQASNHHARRWVQDEFAISFFAQTYAPPIDDASFRLMRDGNFTTVGLFDHLGHHGKLNPDAGQVALQQQLCDKYGLKCLLRLDTFGAAPNGSRVLPQPSKTQWGFYLGDEPNAHAFPSLRQTVAGVRASAPGSMSFINLFGSNVSGEGAGNNPAGWAHEWGAANWSAYAQELVDVVQPDVLCFDHYPVFGRVASDARATDTREEYVLNLALAAAVTRRAHNLPLWLYFNIVPYGSPAVNSGPKSGHDDPTEAQIRWQISTALAYGATGLLYFQWHPMPDGHPGLVMSRQGPPLPSPHYYQAQRLNSWVLALAPTLLHAVPTVTIDLREERDQHPGAVLAAAHDKGGRLLLRNISRGDWTLGFFQLPANTSSSSGSGSGSYTSITSSGGSSNRVAALIANYEHAYVEWATVEWQDTGKLPVSEVSGHSGGLVPVLDDAPDIPGLQLRFEPGEGRLFVAQLPTA